MKKQEVQQKMKDLKGLYIEAVDFFFVNGILLFIWLMFDHNAPFWPKYVIVVWGIVLALKAYSLSLIPFFFHQISFLTPEWEEQKLDNLMGKYHMQRKIRLNRSLKK